MRTILIVVMVAACGYPRPPRLTSDAGGDGPVSGDGPSGPCTDCTLTAVHPAVADVGTTLTLEGKFQGALDMTFPGGVHATGTLLGTNRATVVVPAGATAGPLTASTGGSVPFRATTFGVGLGHFQPYEQLDSARQAPSLVQARRAPCAVRSGPYIYVFGGEDASSNTIGSVEHALINADGTIQPFVPGGALSTARKYSTCIATTGYVYAIGGAGPSGQVTATIEAAPIMSDGTLGNFAAVTSTLSDARQSATAEIIGGYLYVIGGYDRNGATGSVEIAPIQPDGSLGAFTTVSATLMTPREFHTTNVVGNTLYVIGGEQNGNRLGSIEQATIAPDGTLGSFTMSSVSLLNAREQHGSVVLGDHLYVMGGLITGGTRTIDAAPIDSTGALGAFTAVDTWYDGPELPEWNIDATTAGWVIVENYLYAIGGSATKKTVERASIVGVGSIGTSAVGTSTVAVPTAIACSFVLGNYEYLIGGYAGQTDSNVVQYAQIDADGNLGNFTQSTNHLVLGREEPACAIVGNTLYVLGGFNGSMTPRYLTEVESAPIMPDGTLGAFTVSSNTLVIPRGGHRAIILNDGLYVMGGFGTANETLQNTAEVAFINTDGSLHPFVQLSGMPIPPPGRANFIIANFGHWLYLIGGFGNQSSTAEIDELSLTYNSGQIGGDTQAAAIQLGQSRYGASAVLIGNNLFIVGGETNQPSSMQLKSIEVTTVDFAGALGAFPSQPLGGNLSDVREGHSSGVTRNHVWHLAGANFNSEPNTIEQAMLP